MRITTLPVYSKLADLNDVPPEIAKVLPKDWQISQHQLATYQAMLDPDIDVVINTAMTGDGKSLAAYLPVLLDPNRGAFGMYPTNELARDQWRQLDRYNSDFNSKLSYNDLWGAKLSQILAQHPEFTRRAEALRMQLSANQVLLTNPDIFHLMLNYRYQSRVFSSQELPYTLATYYCDFIFDEFHTFSTPQIASTLTAMLFFCATANRQRQRPHFLFSSATPQPLFTELLQISNLAVRYVSGSYATVATEGYRQVLHGTDLHLHKLQDQNAEQWIEDHLSVIKDCWRGQSNPRPRGVIIANSVVEARRIYRLLKERLPGITVGENTGLTDTEYKKYSMEKADLIVGTSTIDVGVDFNINFLIFEATDAGTFLQRFGRLGRFRQNFLPFEHYQAHALFSSRTPWVYDKLVVEGFTPYGISDGSVVDRTTTLRDSICASFPTTTEFRRYLRRWGSLQAAHVIVTLEGREREGSFRQSAALLRGQYQQLLGLKNINSAIGRYRHLLRGKGEPGSITCEAILNEVLSFRGTSPFQTCIWDDSVIPPAFQSYDALVIAQNSDICVADQAPFLDTLAARYPDAEDRRVVLAQLSYGLHYKNNLVVLYVDAFWTERERLILQIDRFDQALQLSQVSLLNGLSIKQPKSEGTKLLNTILRTKRVVGYVTKHDSAKLRNLLHLPAFFPLYQLEDSHGQIYTLALGQAALLLEAEALRLRNKDEENTPIIC